jgi:membrane-bound lytic murein transglycosylase D
MLGLMLMAQGTVSLFQDNDRVQTRDSLVIPEDFSYALDHMLSSWMSTKVRKSPCDTSQFSQHVSDSIINKRLKLMPCVMEMPFNGYVRSFIDLYTVRRKRQVGYLLGLSDHYFKIFEQSLEKYKLPLELKYLPVIESALNPNAISRAGAGGLWQFMVATGRMYGLEVNSLVDDRMDPVKSSNAAAEYLRDLFAIYEDWHLVIAAYNCGPGNVNKAIRRAGGKKDYWTIYAYLPAETRSYVPIFIAANYAMYYASSHNICKSVVEMPKAVDTVMINQRIHFEQISSMLNISVDQIKLMNPQYKRQIIPGDLKPYAVALPVNLTGKFIDKLAEIANYKTDSLINDRREEVIPEPVVQHKSSEKTTYHKVKKGQTLSSIAARYGVSVTKIKQWNGMHNSKIIPGQKLKIKK